MKQKYILRVLITISIIIQIFNCSQSTKPHDDINYAIIDSLKKIIPQDLRIFRGKTIPTEVLNSLSIHKAIIFGEFHTVLEEREMIAKLAISLSKMENNIEICAECPEAYSWIYELVSKGEVNELPRWASYSVMRPVLDSIKTYYAKTNQSIVIHCIDANLQTYFFKNGIIPFSEYFGNSKLKNYVSALIQNTSSDYVDSVKSFIEIIENNPANLEISYSDKYYRSLLMMAHNEYRSIGIRNKWKSDYQFAFANREELLKSNADYFLSRNNSLILFYFGAYHAQKKRYLGSKITWLGDYLHHVSSYSKDNSFSIVGIPLQGQIENSSNNMTMNFNLVLDSKKDDIFRIIGEYNDANYSYFPLSNSIFLNQNIRAKYIFDDAEVEIPLKNQYDAYIIIPTATYISW